MISSLLLALQLAAAPAPAPLTFEGARTLSVAPGHWTIIASPSGGEARFGTRFSIRCNRASRTMTIRRIEPVVSTPLTPIVVITDMATRTLPATGAVLSASDRLLDAMAYSRGRFIVTGGGGSPLVLPAWPEVARSIEDCRN